jgi:hypothetical protein
VIRERLHAEPAALHPGPVAERLRAEAATLELSSGDRGRSPHRNEPVPGAPRRS